MKKIFNRINRINIFKNLLLKSNTFLKLSLIVLLALVVGKGWGQVALPHLDALNYTVGQDLALPQSGWTSLNSGDALLITTGNLSYTGLVASSGAKVTFDYAGIDAAKSFTQQTSGTVYYSFLLNVSAIGTLNTTGGYFTGFTEGAAATFGSTVWTRSDGAGYDIGINPRTTAANTVWSSGTTAINTTLFIVISYQIVASTTNDIVKLWINPTPGGAEPAATLSATNGLTDLANVNRIFIRQDGTSATPFIEMDELRVGTTWADVTPSSATNDANSQVSAGGTGEPATISSLIDTDGERILVFDVTFTDLGTTDGLATIIDQIVFTLGSANEVADWTDAIAGAKLCGNDLTCGVADLAGTVNATNITFSGADFISVADGTNETYQLKIWLNTNLTAISDNDILEFKLIYTNITCDAAGSSFGTGSIESGDANVAIDIDATKLRFVQQPSTTDVNAAMSPSVTVEATDANNNRDLDFTSTIRITSTGTLTGTPVDVAAISGLATFSSLTHTVSGTGLTLNAERQATTDWDITSNTFAINDLPNAWVNEFHYDDDATDASEFVEIIIENPGDYTLSNFRFDLYNGFDGTTYNNKTLNLFTVGSTYGNYTVYTYDFSATFQNGAPDGFALSYSGTLLKFLSYEGTFAATDGPANGVTSSSVGQSETNVAVTYSIRLSGTGCEYTDFTWQAPATSTKGTSNTGQSICPATGTSIVETGTGSEPASISSLYDTQGEAVLNFDFKVTDDGATPATDSDPLKINQIVISAGTGNDIADFSAVLDGALLYDGTNTQTTNITINATNITISSIDIANLGLIADNGIKTYQLKVWLKPSLASSTIDGSNFAFKVNRGSFSVEGTGSSGFESGNGTDVESGGSNNAVSVTATKLAFVQQPSTTNINTSMSPAVTVAALDANNNRDLDYTSSIRITSTGTLTSSPIDVAAVSGVATFSSLSHSITGTGLTLNAERQATTDWDITSNTFNIENIVLDDDFEDGNLTGWGNTTDWTNSTSSPISGTNSIKHNLSGVEGTSYIYYQLSDFSIACGTTIWQLNLRNSAWDPSGNNKFWFYLIANETSLTSSTVDGYAVGVNFTGSTDMLTLWKVTNGVPSAIVTSAFDWNSSMTVGIQVTRDNSGLWELEYDANGNFDALVSAGTNTNTDYTTGDYTGLVFTFSSSYAGGLKMDDVNITKSGCNSSEIEVVGNSVIIVDGDATPSATDDTDFGNTYTASETTDKVFTINNLGGVNLSLSGTPKIVIGGTNAADFSVFADASTPVTPAGNTTFTIRFNPSADGLRQATLSIANDDSDENPYNFSIQGTGIPTPSIAISSTTVSAANVMQGTANHILYKLNLAVTSSDAELTGVTVATAGTYVVSDLIANSFKLRYSTDNSLDGSDATLSTKAIVASGNNISFTGLSTVISSGTTGYLFVTVDFEVDAVVTNTINISSTAFANITFTEGTKSGTDPVAAGGVQTIIAGSGCPATSLIISEIADPGDNSNARFIELFNAGSTGIDFSLSTWYICKQSNGGSTWEDVQLTGSIGTGEVYVIGSNSTQFNTAYGFSPQQINSQLIGDGDDGYFLYEGGTHLTGTLRDAYGVIGVDGTGQAWEYTNRRAYRATGYSTANSTWTAGEWTIGAADVVDMVPEDHTCDCPVPCSVPGSQSLQITFSGVSGSSMTVNWNSGGGERRIVKINTSNSFTAPTNGTDPTANSAYAGGEQVIFNGTGGSVVVTNLVAGTTYWFRVYDYNCTGAATVYITGTNTDNPNSQATISCSDPTANCSNISFSNITNTSMHLTWTRGNGEYCIVLCRATSDVANDPVDLSTYTANATYASGSLIGTSYVVYKGTSDNFTVLGLSASTTYYFKVFEFNCAGGGEKYFTTSPAIGNQITTATAVGTTINLGDLIVLGLCSNTASCLGTNAGSDEISFVCFQDITTGTTLEMTDNGWERLNTGQWGSSEGYIQATRTGTTIASGTVITFRFTDPGTGEYTSIQPDANWTITKENAVGDDLIMNAGGDQIFFMQGGTWTDGTTNLTHNATITSPNILFGFNSNDTWVASNSPQESNLFPGLDCFCMMPNAGASDFLKYTGDLTTCTKREWIDRVNDPDNWTPFTSCAAYYAASPAYHNGLSIGVTSGGFVEGKWTGSRDASWYNCGNWENMIVPDETVNVELPTGSVGNECTIGDPALTDFTEAECNNMTIGTGRTLTINNANSQLNVYGNFTNNATLTHSNGSVTFKGTAEQTISGTSSPSFYNLIINNTYGSGGVTLSSTDITVSNILTLTDGIVTTGTNKVNVSNNNATTAISGGTNTCFINGNLQRTIASNTNTYSFPVGDGTATTNFKKADFINNNLTGLTSLTIKVASLTESANNVDSRLNINQDGTALTDILSLAIWTIDPQGGWVYSAGSYGVKLYTANTGLSSSDDNKFCPVKRDNSSTDYANWSTFVTEESTVIPALGAAGRIYNSGSGFAQRTGYKSFSKHGIAKGGAILPIELLNFTANLKDNSVFLDWTTGSEINNDFFTVERSDNAETFNGMFNIQGAGFSNSLRNYSAIDNYPLMGISYYRLRQTDFDGSFSFSNIEAIENFNSERLSFVSSYTTNNTLTIKLKNPKHEKIIIYINDATGKQIIAKEINDNKDNDSVYFELDNISTGIYYLRIVGTSDIISKKILIQ
ncbi:MAG: hypothetical protein A2046_02080 [Bacteroidetes bacterium GWA2_30_7]|nr:MAG: hypothetical protein A2046_02080 [Bacteroidetes bacterium GWA2_30_7]